MRIAQEEIFGPVLCIIPYETIDEAVAIANDTVYGLGAHVQAQNLDLALGVLRLLSPSLSPPLPSSPLSLSLSPSLSSLALSRPRGTSASELPRLESNGSVRWLQALW